MTTLHRQTYMPTEEEHIKIEEAILEYPLYHNLRSYIDFRKRDWVIFKIGSLTGMRINEILNLNLSWIDWERKSISILAEYNKTKTETKVWINPALEEILKEYIRTFNPWIKEGRLFVGQRGRSNRNSSLTVSNWNYRFTKYLRKAGLLQPLWIDEAGRNQYKFRSHTATRTYFINQVFKANPNRNIFDLSRISRHKNINCLLNHYIRFKDEQIWLECTQTIK